jgi:hypothetical protein
MTVCQRRGQDVVKKLQEEADLHSKRRYSEALQQALQGLIAFTARLASATVAASA